ncbi:MAG TPA: choice-of-anchor Q domain-containing protein, partial [Prosthecobacter sp.]|nr:choice-of-anchor Q domain-containing protein [Prosthecobacter sp.]
MKTRLIVAIASVVLSPALHAATLTVTTNADSGTGSLRQVLADAAAMAGPDTIVFDPLLAGQTISLTTSSNGSAITINDAGGVTIDATGVPGIVIDDGTATSYGLFFVTPDSVGTFRGLTFANGGGANFSTGGGAIGNGGTLKLERCTFSGNSTTGGGFADGGAIASVGTLTLTHCTLTGNSAGDTGGAIDFAGTLTLTHCTLSNNTAGNTGGAIRNAGMLTLNNCIVAGNTAPTNANISGTIGSGSNNLTSGDPKLAALADNGGPVETMALLPGSPALDAGVAMPGIDLDQRGFQRSRDGDATPGALPDIGAYEAQAAPTVSNPNPIVVTTAADEADPNGTLGVGISLREALRDGGGLGSIIFDAALSGQTITLSSSLGDLVIEKSVSIDASSLAGGVTITRDGTGVFRLFTVLPGKTANLAGLTLTGGEGGGQNLTTTGGAFQNAGTLTLTSCTLSGNSATDGGAIFNQGTLTLVRCTLSGNQTNTAAGLHRGGAIHHASGTLSLNNCMLEQNSCVGDGGAIYLFTGTATLANCTLSANSVTDGNGGAILSAGVLTLTDCTLSNNRAFWSNGFADSGVGGAIANTGGTLTLTGCTFAGNATAKTAAELSTPIFDGSARGGAIYNFGTVPALTNCTFVGNSSTGDGGAICNFGPLTITHGTFAGNFINNGDPAANGFAGNGGAISVLGGTLSLGYSIVAGNASVSGPDLHKPASGGGTITPVGTNLIGKNNTVMTEFPQGPLVGIEASPVPANLDPLGDYGGPTQTMRPQPGSLAIDAATGSSTTTDQRGNARPTDGDGNGSVVADLGAAERGTLLLPVVSTTADSGAGSLRQAIADAAAVPDTTITFAAGFTGPIVLASEIVVPMNSVITVDGSNVTAGVVLSGGGTSRIFQVNTGGNLTLKAVTLTGGNGTGTSFSGYGGAISNSGTLTLTQCTLSGNSANIVGGAISNSGTLTLTQCTLSGNSANIVGGAIQNQSTLTLTQCTLSGNSSNDGGGAIYQYGGTLTLTNTIVAGNTAPTGPDIYSLLSLIGDSTITPTGKNLIGNLAGSGLNANGTTVITGAANLAPLGHYGGRTPTMLPLAGSPAIDAGDNAVIPAGVTTDQRGSFLPFNGTVDIGAVERGYVVTNTNGSGAGSLRQAVNNTGTGGMVINFDPALSGETINLSSGITIDRDLEINAGGLANGVTVNGGSQNFRLFQVGAVRTVAMHNLKLINGGGTAFNGFGGAILNDGNLTLTRCALSGNQVMAGNSGGAISSGTGSTLSLTDCALSGNEADFGGAIETVSAATLNRCTLNGNTARAGNGGAIDGGTSANIALTQCTVASNTATALGGGVAVFDGSLSLIHCTLGLNSAANGGGASVKGSFSVANTIFAGNAATIAGPELFENGAFTSLNFTGRIFLQQLGGNGFFASGNVLTGIPELSLPGNYGGATQTIVPLPGSPVLDQAGSTANVGAALNVAFTTDQRGFARAADGDGNGSALADLGAAERCH